MGWTVLVTAAGLVVQAAERGSPARVTPMLLAMFAREAMARGVATAVRPLGWGDPGPRVEPEAERRAPPVLLVPGLDENRAHLGLLRMFLVRRGWPCVWAINRRDRGGVLASEAEALVDRIAELRRVTGADRVDVVGFSTGGLVAAWALRYHPEVVPRVRRLITIGTPWRGTRVAVFGRSRGHEEITWGSHVLDELCPPPVPTVCIWSPDDPGVVPAASALPSHGVESVRIDGAGHVEMLSSARVFRAVQAGLQHPLPAGALPSRETLVPPDALAMVEGES